MKKSLSFFTFISVLHLYGVSYAGGPTLKTYDQDQKEVLDDFQPHFAPYGSIKAGSSSLQWPTSLSTTSSVQKGFPQMSLERVRLFALAGDSSKECDGRVVPYTTPSYGGYLQITFCRIFALPEGTSYKPVDSESYDDAAQATLGLSTLDIPLSQFLKEVGETASPFVMSGVRKESGDTYHTIINYRLLHENNLCFMSCRRSRTPSFPTSSQWPNPIKPAIANFVFVDEERKLEELPGYQMSHPVERLLLGTLDALGLLSK